MKKNIHPIFDQLVGRQEKQQFLQQKSKVLWLTGLSGSGKSSIAQVLEKKLLENRYFSQVLDGDNTRMGINNNLSFTIEDREENIRRIAEISKLYLNSGIIVINSFISPTIKIRQKAKEIIGANDFIEVFIDTPLDVCEARDVKGLYKKSRAGEIKNFTGIDSPYEHPKNPDIVIKTIDLTVEESVEKIWNFLKPLISLDDLGNDKLLDIAKKAAIDAGKAILNVYHSGDFHVEPKNDNSPLTKADKQAHNIIINYLKTTNIPILSEEGHEIPYTERKKWKRFWLVDPLDGTKEFIKRNGEFTVNIALIEFGQPILGVVYIPVSQKLYWALKGHGAYRKDIDGYLIRLVRQRKKGDVVRVIASRSHINKETQDFINRFEEVKVVSRGSSLKFLEIAENTADFYPRFAPTMEWDTGAAQAILEEAGGKVLNQVTKKPLSYNKENLLNPYFLAE